MAKSELIEKQGFGIIPNNLGELLDRTSRAKTGSAKWWARPMGTYAGLRVAVHKVDLDSKNGNRLTALVGDPWVLQGGRFGVQVRQLVFTTKAALLNLGQTGNDKNMISVGGAQTRGGTFFEGQGRGLSDHLTYSPTEEMVHMIGIIAWQGQKLTRVVYREEDNAVALRELIAWTVGLVGLSLS